MVVEIGIWKFNIFCKMSDKMPCLWNVECRKTLPSPSHEEDALHIIDDIILGHISGNTAWIFIISGLF